jgi:hypothetical protein
VLCVLPFHHAGISAGLSRLSDKGLATYLVVPLFFQWPSVSVYRESLWSLPTVITDLTRHRECGLSPSFGKDIHPGPTLGVFNRQTP